MFARMLSNLMPRRRDDPAESDRGHAAEAHAFLSRAVAERPVVEPPDAHNDDPLAALHEPVEVELRRAGYLR